MICIRSVTFTTLAGLGFAPLAHAQPAPTKAAPTARSKAEKIYARGVKAFDEKHFADALKAFEEAYLLDPVPILLYNIARAHEELRSYEEASRYLTRYLDRVPDAEDRPQIEQRLNLLRSAIVAEKAAEVARADAESARADAEEARAAQTRAELGAAEVRKADTAEPSNWLAWAFMGTGTAMVVLGGLAWAGAAQAADDSQAIVDAIGDGTPTPAQRSAHADAANKVESNMAGGWVFTSLGLAAGLVGYWLYESEPGEDSPAVGVMPTPNGFGVIGRF